MLTEKNGKDNEVIENLEKYYPNLLGIQELCEEVDDESTSLSDVPLQLLSKILRMNLEGRDCLKTFETESMDQS